MAVFTSLVTFLLFLCSLQATAAFVVVPQSTATSYRGRRSIAPCRSTNTNNNNGGGVIEYDDMLPCPNPTLEPSEVVRLCMDFMMTKEHNEGLEVCWNFSSDYLQAPFRGSLEKFVEHANNPTFGALVKCTHYDIVNTGTIIPATNTRGAMQTFLMDVQSPDSEDRRFLWTLQRERRPPRGGCWLVHECLYVKNAFQLTI